MSNNKSFIGRGWSFPPEFTKETTGVNMLEGEEDIRTSLELLLSTRPGERVQRPDYGCNLEHLLFEPLTTTLKTYMKDLISTAILYHEPRIEVNNIELDDDAELEGKIIITVEYTNKTTNSRLNFVYPFYKAEGSEVKR